MTWKSDIHLVNHPPTGVVMGLTYYGPECPDLAEYYEQKGSELTEDIDVEALHELVTVNFLSKISKSDTKTKPKKKITK